jgi:hypothetical protein
VNNYEEVHVADREWKYLDEPYLFNYQNQRRLYRKRIAAIIEEGIQKNEIKRIDAPTAVLIILHAVSGIESCIVRVKKYQLPSWKKIWC